MCRLRIGLLMTLTALLFAGSTPKATAERGQLTAGEWMAQVEAEQVGDPGRRAPAYRQRVFRQGPGDEQPELIYEQTSTGSVGINLRDDGLLLVQPVGPLPRLYFPGVREPVELKLPPPREWGFPFKPSAKVGETWFLGDCLFYSRMCYPGHLLLGFARIDADRKTVAGVKLCLEVVEPEQQVARAARASPFVFRAGDYVFWMNAGYDNVYYPDKVPEKWKQGRIRVLNLATAELIEPDRVPEGLLQQQASRVLTFLEEQVHKRDDEMEMWLVDTVARFGGAEEAGRLRELAGTADEPAVRAAYAAALEALEKKGPR